MDLLGLVSVSEGISDSSVYEAVFMYSGVIWPCLTCRMFSVSGPHIL